MKGYLPTLQGRSKWRVHRDNLEPGQLVLVGDAEDLAKRGVYRLGRIHAVHPQIRQGKKIVRRATILQYLKIRVLVKSNMFYEMLPK